AVDVEVKAVNRAGSPSFRTTDIVVPWFVAVVLAAYAGAAYGVVVGIALLVIAAGVIVMVLRPLNRRRTVDRTVAAAFANLENWETLWRMGGLCVRRPGAAPCRAPEGDWQAVGRALTGERPVDAQSADKQPTGKQPA